jgi:Fe-S-cluster containining protein
MCCDRSPEVGLSEAAPLADVFVFRLMFRLYWLPQKQGDSLEPRADPSAFYEKKRLLAGHAARKYPVRLTRDGKTIDGVRYLLISALTVDASPGACAAREGAACGIYERRPLACRTVPFHYSRVEALADTDLSAFVERPGYRCDTSDGADVVIQDGRIVAPGIRQARADALDRAAQDRRWGEAIVRQMKTNGSAETGLPSLCEVEANARFGATTAAMRLAWQIAADSGLMSSEECRLLIEAQLAVIDRELAAGSCGPEARQTLAEMRADYRHQLSGGRGILAFG